ncbi:hypothetical protein E0H73_07665 [Kribbella pittospori]|uniref:Peptidoglycan recognition protein family domain-containing protein n=1 Tax=Kribbella pittospori TaxID=722689 RepID=A0A4R0KTL9_9ACTN|nr:N-acetylmuramoyl-L-alanine amidase [Kribbella pittospori]TCC64281.1 hypothetical protein E0H73_07665 [Kribbella pittospori]
MSTFSRLLPLAVTVVSLVLPTLPQPGDEVEPSYQELSLDGRSVAVETKPFAMVGITWPVSAQTVQARVRVQQNGQWSDWESLTVEDEHSPDPLVPEGIERSGTEPLWVGNATGVQARAESGGTSVADAKVVLIQPGVLAGDSFEPSDMQASASGTPYPMPAMASRKQWGADERLRSHNGAACARPKYTTTVMAAFVHHTADRNDYTRTQVAAMVRGMYAYHVKSRGWCDLGYNFLVDRFGRVFEGRYGGAQLPVLGAHTGSFNTNSFGIALIGNFEKAAPTQAMLEKTARVIAWKFDAYYRSPKSTVVLAGTTLLSISGHRDTKATACPGAQLYKQLPWLRHRVDVLMGGGVATPIYRFALKLGLRAVGPPFWGEHRTRTGWATYFANRDIFYSVATGPHSTVGMFRSRYRSLGAERSRLGLPTTEVYKMTGGSRQRYQHGWLNYNQSRRTITVQYRSAT